MKSLTEMSGMCRQCGFRYYEHYGQIIPCPRCEVESLRQQLTLERQAREDASALGDERIRELERQLAAKSRNQ